MHAAFGTFRQLSAALRLLIVFTVLLGIGYPLLITAVAQLPGLKSRADGSIVDMHGKAIGSALLGQPFTGKDGNPLVQYFQPRPSVSDYDPTATGASNLGPESIVDTLPDPAKKSDTGSQSLLTQVCARSLAVGRFNDVDGARPYCTPDGVGAVLAVFYAQPGYHGRVTHAVSVNQECPATPFIGTYQGAPVTCARFGTDYRHGRIVAIRGNAPSDPRVPADAVTASGSALDPEISLAYAAIQETRIAKARDVSVAQIRELVGTIATGRDLGFMGEPKVNVLKLNLALDAKYPYP
ncbi:MAG TPA: potassium-transporting ATPase subunit C [Jatrophihabitantaceae bacterium]|jgi:K+-transporting ATPase ATPase C chain